MMIRIILTERLPVDYQYTHVHKIDHFGIVYAVVWPCLARFLTYCIWTMEAIAEVCDIAQSQPQSQPKTCPKGFCNLGIAWGIRIRRCFEGTLGVIGKNPVL